MAPAPARAGILEIWLPLWHGRWLVLVLTLLGGLLAIGYSLSIPMRFVAQASFVPQPLLRPSQSASVVSALPALAGFLGPANSPTDLHVAILRSAQVSDRILDRFELQRIWGLRVRALARRELSRRVSFGIGRRDGLVVINVEDGSPVRAASMANEYLAELRSVLRDFALDEARQRSTFYEAQLTRARKQLAEAQRQLQGSGFDRAALRAEPRAAAEGYARAQAEVTAAEVRLASLRRFRTDASSEVQIQLSALSALRGHLAQMQTPRDDDAGGFTAKLRDLRYAEAVTESIARQAEAARVDEAADPVAVQVVDRAKPPDWPSRPVPMLWLMAGLASGFASAALLVLWRHRLAMARLEPGHAERVALILSVLPTRQPWWHRWRLPFRRRANRAADHRSAGGPDRAPAASAGAKTAPDAHA